jgi:dienelactone hydrolase
MRLILFTMANRPIQLIVFLTLAMLPAAAALAAPDTVFFPSADGATEIVAYLFKPQTPGPHPTVVMLHGRGGRYSTNVNKGCTLVSRTSPSPCNATTLSKRHMMWGAYWRSAATSRCPDSFGPRGKAHGFGRFTHDNPERADVNEKTVRPRDAEGALSWLRSRNDVIGSRIFLQGWSNGGSTALNVMQRQGSKPSGYRASLAFYPGCGPKALLAATLATSAPVTLFLGSDDEEVSPTRCLDVARRSRDAGSNIDAILYQGATHGFDDPGPRRQFVQGNRDALDDVLKRAIAVVEGLKD